MADPLTDAIMAAGRELVDEYAWNVTPEDGDSLYPSSTSTFVAVLTVHLRPLLMPSWREARIAQLQAEIKALEES